MTKDTPTSVYRYYDASNILIYVGITGRGVSRNIEHNKSKDWWPFVVRQEVDHFDTRASALAEERRLIENHAPPFNRQHNRHHDLARSSYLAILSEAQRDTSGSPTKRRRHVALTPLEVPFPGDVYTLRSSLDETWILRGGLIQRDGEHQRVSTPQKGPAGYVTDCRFVGGLLVIGIAGKHLPDDITAARAKISFSSKPEGFAVSRVLLNEEVAASCG